MFTKRRKKQLEYQRSLVEQHFNEVENIYRQMRGWRHDYHNHIQVLAACLDNGKIREAREYLEQINENLVSVDTVLKTGNTMVDAILNSKIALMDAKHIAVKATARVPAEIAVENVDLCIIIGNLLDNAMEACEKLQPEERFVRIYIGLKNNHLYMSFTNSAGEKAKKAGGRFLSAKGLGHGFGLERIDILVEKYGGYLTRASEDGGFTTEVILPTGV